jgi:hypothetical protein
MATSDGRLESAPGGSYKELIETVRGYEPLIPAAVVEHHLRKAGCVINDPDLVRIVALAAQELTCRIVKEADAVEMGRGGKPNDLGKRTLSTKDLETALANQGIISETPPIHVSK